MARATSHGSNRREGGAAHDRNASGSLGHEVARHYWDVGDLEVEWRVVVRPTSPACRRSVRHRSTPMFVLSGPRNEDEPTVDAQALGCHSGVWSFRKKPETAAPKDGRRTSRQAT